MLVFLSFSLPILAYHATPLYVCSSMKSVFSASLLSFLYAYLGSCSEFYVFTFAARDFEYQVGSWLGLIDMVGPLSGDTGLFRTKSQSI